MAEQRNVEVRHMGNVPYQDAFSLMKQLQKLRIENEIIDTLLILEHPEIVTIGPRARSDGIKVPDGYSTFPVDRGGGLTWHGPGQIVAYPIFKWNLPNENSVTKIITIIEQWVINTLEKLGIQAIRDERMQGVWVNDHKICSIGLSFLRWTSRHGFTINLDTPSTRVENLSGCGLKSSTTTCLKKLGFEINRDELVKVLIEEMEVSTKRSVL